MEDKVRNQGLVIEDEDIEDDVYRQGLAVPGPGDYWESGRGSQRDLTDWIEGDLSEESGMTSCFWRLLLVE